MNQVYKFTISDRDRGRRLDEVLAARFGFVSRMRLANLVAAGACVVNNEPAQSGRRLRVGDLIEFELVDSGPTSMSPEPTPLEIVHEDDEILVVVKPAGMLVHPTMQVKSGTLANALAYHLNRRTPEVARIGDRNQPTGEDPEPISPDSMPATIRPGLVHRLDKPTSGLMVVAKTARALRVLWRHFNRRMVEKTYTALVHGEIEDDFGTIVAPIGRDTTRKPFWGVLETGKPAETRFKVVERFGGFTLVEMEPVTGRTNQLRIHAAHAGHPIVGDELFNLATDARGAQMAVPSLDPPASRLCLHASRLAFHHPANGEWCVFESRPPGDFAAVAERLRPY
jgi:23S rRNA pseudouridine1911/1915/1917 synthase